MKRSEMLNGKPSVTSSHVPSDACWWVRVCVACAMLAALLYVLRMCACICGMPCIRLMRKHITPVNIHTHTRMNTYATHAHKSASGELIGARVSACAFVRRCAHRFLWCVFLRDIYKYNRRTQQASHMCVAHALAHGEIYLFSVHLSRMDCRVLCTTEHTSSMCIFESNVWKQHKQQHIVGTFVCLYTNQQDTEVFENRMRSVLPLADDL